MNNSLLSLEMISFVLFPQASLPSMIFTISELVYSQVKQTRLNITQVIFQKLEIH